MRRIMLTVAYDGTDFHGWQVQPGVRTVEGELNRALSDWLKEEVIVIGASRTDTGVHAMGNLAVFDTKLAIPAEKVPYALNTKLPGDVKIQSAMEVPAEFHPRHCESRKTYEYRFYTAKHPNPLKNRYATYTYMEPDVLKMQQAAAYLVGEHDFKSFCQVGAQVKSTVRRVTDVSVSEDGADLVIRVTGEGFLYNMVRIMVGTLLEVGLGKREPRQIQEILEAKNREAAGPTAPAHGLTLVKYEFLQEMQEYLEK